VSDFDREWDELRARMREVLDLDAVVALLGWDEETYLPPAAHPDRGRQVALVEALRHRLLVAPRLGELLDEIGARPLDEERAAIVARLGRRRERAVRVPEPLVRALAEARSAALDAWGYAREELDFGLFAPRLRALLDLVRERAHALLDGSSDPYDALLDEHEPGLTRAALEPLLVGLCDGLRPLLAAVAEAAPAEPRPLAHLHAPVEAHARLSRRLLEQLGFDFARGRNDRSTHPFTLQCGPHDVRLTTRVSVDDPLLATLTAAHECGHALYDQGFAPAHLGTVLAEAPSIGMHEAQARLWENHVARRRVFWERWLPVVREEVGGALAGISVDEAHRHLNAVAPGPVRVQADELSYDLHVLVRYRLETALLDGDLPVEELPGAWRETLVATFDRAEVAPRDDLEGCLQDVHWALGELGYFPTYTVGNLYAAQLVAAFERAEGPLDAALAGGRFDRLLEWLRERVHRRGHLESAEDTIRRATGAALSAAPYLDYLRRKYAELYPTAAIR
jgi:carboxypeptidase Taq